MSFKNWFVQEMRGQYNANNTIVVDIQPEYAENIGFDIGEFANFITQMLSKGRKVLYFHNGEDMGMSNANTIKSWLAANLVGEPAYAGLNYESYGYGDYDDGYEDEFPDSQYEDALEALNGAFFYDKGYGFLRDWMDQGVDEHIIIQAIRAMAMYKCSSRDLPEEVLEELGDGDDLHQHGEIHLPHFDLGYLRSFNGAFICGGGENECLREVQLMMNAFNIGYRVFSQFVF